MNYEPDCGGELLKSPLSFESRVNTDTCVQQAEDRVTSGVAVMYRGYEIATFENWYFDRSRHQNRPE